MKFASGGRAKRDAGPREGDPADGDVPEVAHQDGRLAGDVAGLRPSRGRRRRRWCAAFESYSASAVTQRRWPAASMAVTRSCCVPPNARIRCARLDFDARRPAARRRRRSRPPRRSSGAAGDSAGCPSSIFLPPPCGTWPVALSSSRLLSGAAGKMRRPRASIDQGLIVRRRVEAEDAELEAVLPLGLAVAAAGVAAGLGQDRNDLLLERQGRRLDQPCHFDRHGHFRPLEADDNPRLPLRMGNNEARRVHRSYGRVAGHVSGGAGAIHGFTVRPPPGDEKLLAGLRAIEPHRRRADHHLRR